MAKYCYFAILVLVALHNQIFDNGSGNQNFNDGNANFQTQPPEGDDHWVAQPWNDKGSWVSQPWNDKGDWVPQPENEKEHIRFFLQRYWARQFLIPRYLDPRKIDGF
ncbi:hypothetical protein PCANC_08840 [Puccinia coronata f. sp. avenae]|uniref:Uncharacterized protein n=1 Tax=Puccinia coronata f. sp. avenae TaxID=200324 RepID=A0A2N5SYX1_9BASI|nr:hypothetical protein PCANC_08840 [Puccinia coronata f. sp. avenae]